MKKFAYSFIVFAALLFSSAALAEPSDELLRNLTSFNESGGVKQANDFFRQLDKEQFTDSLVQFPANASPDLLRQQVYYWAAEYFYDKQLWAEAEKYGLKALPFCKRGTDRTLEGNCLNILSLINVRQGKFEKAAEFAKQCNQLDLQSGNADVISSSYNTLAGIYMSARQPKEAEKYILKAIEYSQRVENLPRRAVLYGMASEIYHAIGDEQQAYDYARQAYETETTLGRTDKAFIREAQMASALIGLRRFDEAKTLLRKVIPAFRDNGNRQSLGISCNRMGSLLLNEGENEGAAKYFEEALAVFIENKDLYNESFSRNGLYRALKSIDPAASMRHLERCNELKDSIYDEKTGELLSKYAALYDNEQLQAENKSERAAHRRTMVFATLVLLLVVFVAWYVVRRIQRRHQLHTQTLIREIEQLRRKLPAKPAEPAAEQPAKAPEAEEEKEEEEDDDSFFLMRVIEVVNEKLPAGSFGLEHIAYEMNMSVSTFRRRLQNASGEAPKSYISAIQMEKAANLLREKPDLPVLDVSLQCGFEDMSSFGRQFKRTYGCTPSEFRKLPEEL